MNGPGRERSAGAAPWLAGDVAGTVAWLQRELAGTTRLLAPTALVMIASILDGQEIGYAEQVRRIEQVIESVSQAAAGVGPWPPLAAPALPASVPAPPCPGLWAEGGTCLLHEPPRAGEPAA